MLAYEFCKITKLHLDQILSDSDVSLVSKTTALKRVLNFEKSLQSMFKEGSMFDQNVYEEEGKTVIDAGSADEIREKYKAKEEGFGFDKDVKGGKKRKGKTKMSAHIYKFEGCISECFEPYL